MTIPTESVKDDASLDRSGTTATAIGLKDAIALLLIVLGAIAVTVSCAIEFNPAVSGIVGGGIVLTIGVLLAVSEGA